jgi:hypothetical protein
MDLVLIVGPRVDLLVSKDTEIDIHGWLREVGCKIIFVYNK